MKKQRKDSTEQLEDIVVRIVRREGNKLKAELLRTLDYLIDQLRAGPTATPMKPKKKRR